MREIFYGLVGASSDAAQSWTSDAQSRHSGSGAGRHHFRFPSGFFGADVAAPRPGHGCRYVLLHFG